jgi:hypothetical protein
MSRVDTLPTESWQHELSGQPPERALGFDERDEALIATTAFIGPIATMFARNEGRFEPMAAARPLATAEDVSHTVEFIPTVEAEPADWRLGAREHVAGAAIMFASERPDMTHYSPEDLELAA